MFGMMEAMLSFLRRQIGLRTDSASASGSLHAKIANLRNIVNDNITKTPWEKTPTLVYGSFHSVLGDNTIQSIIKINGPRIILGGFVGISGCPDRSGSWRSGLYLNDDPLIVVGRDSDNTIYKWSSDDERKLHAFRHPFSATYDETDNWKMPSLGIFELPMFYMATSLELKYQTGNTPSASFDPLMLYCIMHCAV